MKEMLYTQKEAVNIKEFYIAVKKGHNEELLSLKKHINREAEQLNDRGKKVVFLTESVMIDFMPAIIDFMPTNPQFGHFIIDANLCAIKVTDLPPYIVTGEEAKFTIITNDCNGNCYSKGGRHIQLLHYTTGAFINAEVKDKNDGSYLVPLSHREVNFFVSIDGQQTARAWYSIAVRDYSSISKPSIIVEDDDNCSMESPWGIAWSRRGTWAMADYTKDCVYLSLMVTIN